MLLLLQANCYYSGLIAISIEQCVWCQLPDLSSLLPLATAKEVQSFPASLQEAGILPLGQRLPSIPTLLVVHHVRGNDSVIDFK